MSLGYHNSVRKSMIIRKIFLDNQIGLENQIF